MKITILSFLAIIGLFSFVYCNKNETTIISDLTNNENVNYYKRAEEPLFANKHDAQLSELAKAIGQTLRDDSDVRQFIKREVLLRFDGDYDFLIKDAIDKPVGTYGGRFATRSGQAGLSFGEIIRSNLNLTKSDVDLLEELQRQYPDLQIAVPVHANEWDPETFTPVIAFLPEDYDDAVTETVPGYDADGDYVEVDAVNPPDVPVIVISHNERQGRGGGQILPDPDSLLLVLLPPTGLVGVPTSSGIVLSWNYDETEPAIGFNVWRKGQNDNTFVNIANLFGIANRGYQDTQVVAGATYQYYVTAYALGVQSLGSNHINVVAPPVVDPLTSFSVLSSGYDVECEWTHGQVPYADVVIEHKGPYDSNYSVLTRITNWSTNYCYSPNYRGMRHNYRIYRDNGMSQSDALTDFIYPPYRNTNGISNVYIKKIDYPYGLEGWLRGDAEFDIVVLYYDRLTESIKSYYYFTNPASGDIINMLIREWRCFDMEKDWCSLMSIFINERDCGGNTSMNLDIKYTYKSGDALNTTIQGQYVYHYEDEDDVCGSVDLYYYDNPERVLLFPMEGVEVTLTEAIVL